MAKLLLGTLIGIIVPQILRILGRLTLSGHFQWADCDLSTVVRWRFFHLIAAAFGDFWHHLNNRANKHLDTGHGNSKPKKTRFAGGVTSLQSS